MDFFSLIHSKNMSGGSGGIEYSSIVYNEDNTVTLTEKDGTIHTMSYTYQDDKIIEITYDGKAIDLTYDNDELIKFCNVDISGISVYPQNDYIQWLDGSKTIVDDSNITALAISDLSILFPNAKSIKLSEFVSPSQTISNTSMIIESIDLPKFEGTLLLSPSTTSKENMLTYVNAPNVITLAGNCFRGRKKLTGKIKFNRLTTIGGYAFCQTNFECIDLPNTLTSMNTSNTFYNNPNLKSLVIRSPKLIPISNVTLLATPIETGEGYVYVPDDLVDSYKSANYWSEYANQIRPLSEYIEE